MTRVRWIISITVLAIGGMTACESSTAPSADADFRGILAWDDPPTFAQMQGDHTGGDELTAIEPPALEAPDTVSLGELFRITVTTILPNGCWRSGATEVDVEEGVATIDVFDRGPRTVGAPCTLIYSWASREIALAFHREGEAVIRVVGRRIQGEDYGDESKHTVEQVVIVR